MQEGVGSPALDLASAPQKSASSPRIYWCCAAIIAINLVVFAAMNAQMPLELDGSFPTSQAVKWGASYGPSTFSGQAWRLIASAFIHYNFSHIGYNMAVLALLGSEVEKRYGHFKFVVIYLFAAVAGSCLSLLLSPVGAGAGASGACYGMGGAVLSYLMLQKSGWKPFPLTWFGTIGMLYLAQSVYFATVGGAVSANHVGGLIAGFLTGYTFYNAPGSAPRSHQAIGISFIVVSMVALFVSVTYAPLDFKSNYKLAKAVHEIEQGNFASAKEQLHDYIKSQPQSPLGYFQLAGLAHMEKHDNEAKVLFEQAQALHYPGADLLSEHADTCYELGLNQIVVNDALKSASQYEDLRVLARAVDGYAEMGQYDKAFAQVERMKKSAAAKRLAQVCEAELWRWQGQLDKACDSLKEPLSKKPPDVRASDLMASIMAEQGRYVECRSLLESLQGQRNKSTPYNFEATMYLALDDYRAAGFVADHILSDKELLADGSAAYGAVYKWFSLEAAKDTAGQKALATKVDHDLKLKCWPYPLYLYLNGTLSYEALLKAADTAGKMTELKTFMGLRAYVHGDYKTAMDDFRLVRDKGLKAYMENDLARIIVARMERKATGKGN